MRTSRRSPTPAALPIILHDIPSRTIRELSDDTLVRLAQSRQFIGLRDGTGDVLRPMRLRLRLPSGFRLLSGDDATALAFIANGGDGCISTISNVAPELCQAIFSNCRQGRLQSARYLQNRLAPLNAALSRESPAALKYALSCSALCARAPACRSWNWPNRRRPRSGAPSRRSATRIWPVRARFGTAPAPATGSPLKIDPRESLPIAEAAL